MLEKTRNILLHSTGETIQSLGLLLLRAGTSVLMIINHGWPKYARYESSRMDFFDPFGIGSEFSLILAIFAEIVCSLLLISGLFTRLAVVPLIITMAVAAFLFNAGSDFIVKERAVLFLLVYSTLLLTGSGKYSLDHIIYQRKEA